MSSDTYNVTVTGFTPHDGDLTLTVSGSNNITSVRTGNELPENPTPTGESQTYTIATDPEVSAVSFSGFTLDNNDLDGVNVARFRVSFNEAVTGVDAADFNYSLNGVAFDPNIPLDTLNSLATNLTPGSVQVGTFNGVTLSVAPTDNSGRNYEVTVTGLEQSGNVDLDISFASDYEIQDEASNDLVFSDLITIQDTYTLETGLQQALAIGDVITVGNETYTVAVAASLGDTQLVLDRGSANTGSIQGSVTIDGQTYTIAETETNKLGGSAFIDNVITFVRTGAAGGLLDPIFETADADRS